MSDEYLHSTALMGTVVTIHVVGAGEGDARERAVERAIGWFRDVEARCTRFDPASEVMRVTSQIGVPVAVSAMLFEVVQFALAVAQETDGAFDPTVGVAMERRGFNENYRTGFLVRTDPGDGANAGIGVSYRDVLLDSDNQTVTLRQPLVLDLGAVAKGLAIDLAAQELRPFVNFAIDAGGDLYFGGRNAAGGPWTVGIRHPRAEHEVTETLCVSDMAVCTSGDYERVSPGEGGGHHIVDPRNGRTATAAASATVVAPSAMVADALATAAFVVGPTAGIELLDRHGVDGVIITPSLERFATARVNDRFVRAAPGGASR